MDVEWECTDDFAASGPDEELTGGPHPPRWVRRVPRAAWWALALLAAVAAAAPAVSRHATRQVAGPPAASASASASPPGTAPAVAPGAGDAPPGAQAALALVRQVALEPGPLAVYIRASAVAGACPLMRPGDSPRRRISALLRRQVPVFRVTDTGFTLDPFTAMCSLQLRARAGDGSVLVVDVVAPERGGPDAGGTKSMIGTVSDGFVETSYALEVTASGWMVTVGSTGPAGEQPSTMQLQKLAQDSAMNW